MTLFVLIACDDEFEINLGNEIENPANFQVDFDGETYVADIATANIFNGVTTITATKHETNEVFVLTLNNDVVGEYNFVSGQNIGENKMTVKNEDAYVNSKTFTSGRIDLLKIDDVYKTLNGTFSFLGTRFIQQFDTTGNPIIDTDGKLVFNAETKIFTEGTFSNIIYTEADHSIIPTNQFYASMDVTQNTLADGVDYIEDSIVARKETFGAQSYITIAAKKQGFESVVLKIPSGVMAGDNFPINDAIVSGGEVVGSYTLDKLNYYLALNQATDMIHITSHNFVSKKIEGTFNFDTNHVTTGDWIRFSDGSFSVTYTDD